MVVENALRGSFLRQCILIAVSYAIIQSLLIKPLQHLAENSKEIDGEAFNCMYFLLSITNTLHTLLMMVIMFACGSSFCGCLLSLWR